MRGAISNFRVGTVVRPSHLLRILRERRLCQKRGMGDFGIYSQPHRVVSATVRNDGIEKRKKTGAVTLECVRTLIAHQPCMFHLG